MDSKHRKLSKWLRVSRELLLLLDITILTNKPDENDTSWFTDREMTTMLLLLRDPVYKRIQERAKQDVRQRKRRKQGVVKKTTDPPVKINGEGLKVGLQFSPHSVSRTCMIPKEGPRALSKADSHSGGSCDSMTLFPEKLQVIVKEDPDNEKSSCIRVEEESGQPISSYFTTDACKKGIQSAKRKKLTLRRIVSASGQCSLNNKASAACGGFGVDFSQDSESASHELEHVAEPPGIPPEVGGTEDANRSDHESGPLENLSGGVVGSHPESDPELEERWDSPLEKGEALPTQRDFLGVRGEFQHKQRKHPRGSLDCASRVETSEKQDEFSCRRDYYADLQEKCINRAEVMADKGAINLDEREEEQCESDGPFPDGGALSNESNNGSIDDGRLSPLLDGSASDDDDDKNISPCQSPILAGRRYTEGEGQDFEADSKGEGILTLDSDSCAGHPSPPLVGDVGRSPLSNRTDRKKLEASELADKLSVSGVFPSSGRSSENVPNDDKENLSKTDDTAEGSVRSKGPILNRLKMTRRIVQRSKENNSEEVTHSEDAQIPYGNVEDHSSKGSPVFGMRTQKCKVGHEVEEDDRTGVELDSRLGAGLPEFCDEERSVPSLPPNGGDGRKRQLAQRVRISQRTLSLSSSDEEDSVSFDLSRMLQERRSRPQQKRRKLRNRSGDEKLGSGGAAEPREGSDEVGGTGMDVVECRASSSSDEMSLPTTSFLSLGHSDPKKGTRNATIIGEEHPSADGLTNGDSVVQEVDYGRQKKNEGLNEMGRTEVTASRGNSDRFFTEVKAQEGQKLSRQPTGKGRGRGLKELEQGPSGHEVSLSADRIDHNVTTNGLPGQWRGGEQLRNNSSSLDKVVLGNRYVQYPAVEVMSSSCAPEPHYHEYDEHSHFRESDGSLHMTDERGSVFVGQRNVVFNLSEGKYNAGAGRQLGKLGNSTIQRNGPEESVNSGNSSVTNDADSTQTAGGLHDGGKTVSEGHGPISDGRTYGQQNTPRTQTKRQIDTFDLTDSKDVEEVISPQLDKGTCGRQKFFQAQNYGDVGNDDDSSVNNFVPSKQPKKKIKKKPLSVINSLPSGNTAFGSLKRFDDSATRKPGSRKRKTNRRESQIEVNPENLEKWWVKTSHTKEKKRAPDVIDLVAMEEKMKASLKSVMSVSDLAEDQLQFLTQHNEGYLREIFQGKCLMDLEEISHNNHQVKLRRSLEFEVKGLLQKPSRRHTEYKSSTALRARMTYLVSYGDFSEDSLEAVMDTLVPMFCRNGSSKYLDYVSKVLLPELLNKICMDVLHVSYDEAEKMF